MKTELRQSAIRTPHSAILVTGGAGFIGSHLVERLLADGHRVVVIDDLSTGRLGNLKSVRRHPRLEIIVSKVSKCPQLKSLARNARCIYHLAAAVGVELVVREPIRTIHTNLLETEAILEAASGARTPLLLASTSEVYGKSTRESFAEGDDLVIGPPSLTRWSYACSKLMDEFLALAFWRERQLPVVVARLFNTVGPRQTGRYGMVLPRFIAAAKAGKPLQVYGDGRQTRCFCYVQDTVESLVRLMNCPAAVGEVFNVGGTEETSLQDLARLVIHVLGSVSKLELIPYDQAYAPGFEDMRRRKPAIAKLKQVTGFAPYISLEEIVRRTAL
ncbi:MAG: GDP-mannose 4,6-dehydratase [Verrucomicrobiota bacterium]